MATDEYLNLPIRSSGGGGGGGGTIGQPVIGADPDSILVVDVSGNLADLVLDPLSVLGVQSSGAPQSIDFANDGDFLQRQNGAITSTNVLLDASNVASIQVDGRLQIASGGLSSHDWENRVLQSGGSDQLDYGNNYLLLNGSPVLAWQVLHLISGPGVVLDWGSLQLLNNAGVTLDWGAQTLSFPGLPYPSVDWANCILHALNDGHASVDWNNQFLNNGTLNTVDWFNSLLLSPNGTVMDWSVNKLYGVFGDTDPSIDFGNRVLINHLGNATLDYFGRFANDASGNPSFGWGTGGITSYNGDTLAGNGVATIPGSVAALAQTASISTTTINTPTGHLYRANVVLLSDVAGTSGTVSCGITYKDPTGTSHTINPAGTLTLGTGTLGNSTQGSIIFACDGSTAIQYATTLTSPIGSPKYNVYITIERLQ